MVSFNYFDQDGILKNIDFKRYTGRFNLDQELASWLDLGIRFTASMIDKENTQSGGFNQSAGVIGSAYVMPSFMPVKDANGEYTINPERPTVANPVSFLEIDDNTKEQRMFANTFLDIDLARNLSAKISYGIDNNIGKRQRYYPKSFLYGKLVNGDAAIMQNNDFTQLTEITLNYQYEIMKDLNMSVLAGYSWQKFEYESVSSSNTDFLTDLFLYNSLESGAALRPGVSSGKSANEYLSYFSRLHFNMKDKYLLTLTMRADGSSRFGKNNKYGYFPSGALAWRISEEDFLKDNNTLSDLKLRLSYGQTGNANIGGNAFAYYSTGSNYAFGNKVNVGVAQSQLENPDLKWETTTEMNLGIDFGLFDNHVYGTLELYKRNISDILSSRALPSYLPIGSVAANIGETESKGIEFSLKTINLDGPLKWETDLTIGSFRDKWVHRDPKVILPVYERENAPLHAIYGYKTDGIIQIGEIVPQLPNGIPGDLKIQDINGVDENNKLTGKPDGKISDADIVLLGSSQPGWTFGLNNTFRYKQFDLGIFFYGMMDRLLYDTNRQVNTSMENIGNNNGIKDFLSDVWSTQNPTGTLPTQLRRTYVGDSDFFMENASFVRLKNVTLGYSFNNNSQLLKSFKDLRFYADISNVFVLTSYKGGDPEIDSISAYPFPSTISIGINAKF